MARIPTLSGTQLEVLKTMIRGRFAALLERERRGLHDAYGTPRMGVNRASAMKPRIEALIDAVMRKARNPVRPRVSINEFSPDQSALTSSTIVQNLNNLENAKFQSDSHNFLLKLAKEGTVFGPEMEVGLSGMRPDELKLAILHELGHEIDPQIAERGSRDIARELQAWRTALQLAHGLGIRSKRIRPHAILPADLAEYAPTLIAAMKAISP